MSRKRRTAAERTPPRASEGGESPMKKYEIAHGPNPEGPDDQARGTHQRDEKEEG